MKKTNDKEKSIKPRYWPPRAEESPVDPTGSALGYCPAWLWPNVPEDCDYSWVQVVRDWLCEIVVGGRMEEYVKMELISLDPPHEMEINKIRVDLYSHTYWYCIEFTKDWISTKVLERKPRAGASSTYHTIDQYHGKDLLEKTPFSFQGWYFLKNAIMRNEFVKVFNQARTEDEWKKLMTKYGQADGTLIFCEWEQKEGDIRNVKRYRITPIEEDKK